MCVPSPHPLVFLEVRGQSVGKQFKLSGRETESLHLLSHLTSMDLNFTFEMLRIEPHVKKKLLCVTDLYSDVMLAS